MTVMENDEREPWEDLDGLKVRVTRIKPEEREERVRRRSRGDDVTLCAQDHH